MVSWGTRMLSFQQEPNGTVAFAEGTPNLMQRLSRLPTAPHVGPLLSGEPIPFSLGHEHHLIDSWLGLREALYPLQVLFQILAFGQR
jgi:hypothetical protein